MSEHGKGRRDEGTYTLSEDGAILRQCRLFRRLLNDRDIRHICRPIDSSAFTLS